MKAHPYPKKYKRQSKKHIILALNNPNRVLLRAIILIALLFISMSHPNLIAGEGDEIPPLDHMGLSFGMEVDKYLKEEV